MTTSTLFAAPAPETKTLNARRKESTLKRQRKMAIILAIIVAIFSSVAMSGIPGGGGTGELVLCTIFFPDQMAIAYPIAIALGNLVDPPATMVNAAGDYVVSYIVEKFVNGKDWLQKQLKAKQ